MRAVCVGAMVAMLLGLAGCPESGTQRRVLGAACGANAECGSGVCGAGQCLDPDLDSDSDGLLNRLEASLRTNPALADSDGDGEDDLAEVALIAAPLDADGDGAVDAVESSIGDLDLDCIPDELDPFDDQPADLAELANQACCCDGLCSDLETDAPVIAECMTNQPAQNTCFRTSDCPLGLVCEVPVNEGECVTPGLLGMGMMNDMPVSCRTDGDCPELTVCDATNAPGICVGGDGLIPPLPPTLVCTQPGAMLPVRLRPDCADTSEPDTTP